MRLEEQLIIAAFKNVNQKCGKELALLGVELKVPTAPFPELQFPGVYDILAGMGKKIEYGGDMDTEAEKLLWEHVKEKYKTEFWFVNRFPFKKKPFYVMRVDETPEFARSVDLYYTDIEMSSGGQRENRYDKLMANVKEKGLGLESVEWFTKFFKYGIPTHGGFGLGIERLTQVLLKLSNIREAVLFPRDTQRLTP
jgi:aspartyl-tRNA synthetase